MPANLMLDEIVVKQLENQISVEAYLECHVINPLCCQNNIGSSFQKSLNAFFGHIGFSVKINAKEVLHEQKSRQILHDDFHLNNHKEEVIKIVTTQSKSIKHETLWVVQNMH